MTTTETVNDKAVAYANDLRAAADLIEKAGVEPTFGTTVTYYADGDEMRRIRHLFGGKWDKDADPDSVLFQLYRKVGNVTLKVVAWRESVCEAVEIERTETVPDPDARAALDAEYEAKIAALPLVEQTVTETKWECGTVLS